MQQCCAASQTPPTRQIVLAEILLRARLRAFALLCCFAMMVNAPRRGSAHGMRNEMARRISGRKWIDWKVVSEALEALRIPDVTPCHPIACPLPLLPPFKSLYVWQRAVLPWQAC